MFPNALAADEPVSTWRTSSYSTQGGGNCVEAGPVVDEARVAVRDTKNRARGHFTVPHAVWMTFVRSVTR